MSSMFLKLDGIQGESHDRRHTGWIEISEMRWAVSQDIPAEGHQGIWRACFVAIEVLKVVDKSSLMLGLACIRGTPIRDAIIECVRLLGSEALPFYRIHLGNVLVAGIESQTARSGEAQHDLLVQQETVKLNFAEITWEWTEVDPRGNKSGVITREWSLEKQKSI